MKYFILFGLLVSQLSFASHKPVPGIKTPTADFYRELTLKIRQSGEFAVPFPGNQSSISYNFEFGTPVYAEPMIGDSHLYPDENHFYRAFFDRILFKDGSHLLINGEKLPLTCIFINGQDNRFSGVTSSPLLPQFILKVYLVANDFACQGPIRPGFPATGGREENWETYLYYEIRDPTIMLPVEAKLRFRWNEYSVVLTDSGNR